MKLTLPASQPASQTAKRHTAELWADDEGSETKVIGENPSRNGWIKAETEFQLRKKKNKMENNQKKKKKKEIYKNKLR